MSIDRQYGKLIFVCDDCGEGFIASSREFPAAWAEAKDEGWTATNNGARWIHWCHSPCEPSE